MKGLLRFQSFPVYSLCTQFTFRNKQESDPGESSPSAGGFETMMRSFNGFIGRSVWARGLHKYV